MPIFKIGYVGHGNGKNFGRVEEIKNTKFILEKYLNPEISILRIAKEFVDNNYIIEINLEKDIIKNLLFDFGERGLKIKIEEIETKEFLDKSTNEIFQYKDIRLIEKIIDKLFNMFETTDDIKYLNTACMLQTSFINEKHHPAIG